MLKKGVIIGTFIDKKRILSFFELIKYRFNINLEKTFVYSMDSNDKEYLVTFKTYDKDRFVKNLSGSTIMHVKNNCLFSINALNKLIEDEYNSNSEASNNEVEIDWEKYKNKLIILTNGTLKIDDLTKIEDKCYFLQ